MATGAIPDLVVLRYRRIGRKTPHKEITYIGWNSTTPFSDYYNNTKCIKEFNVFGLRENLAPSK